MNLPENYVVLGKGGSFQIPENPLMQDQRFTGAMSVDGQTWGAEEEVSGRSTAIYYAAPLGSDVAKMNGHHQDPGHGILRGILQGGSVDTGEGVNPEYRDASFFEVTQEIRTSTEHSLPPEDPVVGFSDKLKFDRLSEMREAIRNAKTISEVRAIVKADWDKSKAATQINSAWGEVEMMGVGQALAEEKFPKTIPEAIAAIEGKALPEMPVDRRTDPLGGCVTHHFACNCREALMAESMQTQRKLVDWSLLSDEGIRLRCGELSTLEIRTVRAVLSAILPAS